MTDRTRLNSQFVVALLGVAPEGEPYSPEPFRPDYLVDGPWSGWARLYDEYVERDCALETAVGPYTLYACAQ